MKTPPDAVGKNEGAKQRKPGPDPPIDTREEGKQEPQQRKKRKTNKGEKHRDNQKDGPTPDKKQQKHTELMHRANLRSDTQGNQGTKQNNPNKETTGGQGNSEEQEDHISSANELCWQTLLLAGAPDCAAGSSTGQRQ